MIENAEIQRDALLKENAKFRVALEIIAGFKVFTTINKRGIATPEAKLAKEALKCP